jgi:redox-regulated HSP33 family molecular chaperone
MMQIVSGEIAVDMAHYLTESEQVGPRPPSLSPEP